MERKEELTTEMQFEFMEKDFSHSDFLMLAVYGATNRGMPLEEALKKYGIFKEAYENNIERILNS